MAPQMSLDGDMRSIYTTSGSPIAHAGRNINCNKHVKGCSTTANQRNAN